MLQAMVAIPGQKMFHSGKLAAILKLKTSAILENDRNDIMCLHNGEK